MKFHLSRRQVLAGSASGLLPLGARAQSRPVTTLTAGRRILEVKGQAAPVFGLTQPDGTQGLHTDLGRRFRVVLNNDCGVDTLVHWHGLTPPWQQDGVPGISGPAVPPGGSASYDFPLTVPGTFWMHSHQGLQEQALLTGPLIVRDPAAAGLHRQEVVLMLHDFSFKPPGEILAGLRGGTMAAMPGMVMPAHGRAAMPGHAGMTDMVAPPPPPAAQPAATGMAMDLNDVMYDAFLANDRTLDDPQVVRVERGGRVLLRVINAAASSNFRIDLGRVTAQLVAVDGQAIQPVDGSVFPVAVAQRLDLALTMPPDHATLPILAVLEGERTRTGMVLATPGGFVDRLDAEAQVAAAPLGLAQEATLRAARPLVTRRADRVHCVDLTGSMETYVWGLNGRTYAEAEPLMVRQGERVELVMTNRTGMSHPMHLHGHAFQVVAVDGQRFAGAVRDTVLVPSGKAVTVAFDADNPGLWAFHCHNLYHMQSGMMTTVRYEMF